MKNENTLSPSTSVDATTIHLIINSGVLLAKYALGAGIFLACFVLCMVNVRPESASIAAVVMTAAAGLLGGPALAMTALYSMLARTRTEPQTPTGTPSDPFSVAGAAPSADAPPVATKSAAPDADSQNDTTAQPGQKDNSNE